MRQGARRTYAEETDAANNCRILGRGHHVVGGTDETLWRTAGGALDDNSLGRHLEKSGRLAEGSRVGGSG